MDGADGSTNFRDGQDLGKEEKVICLRTESAENIIDDGYEWKKYGQKRIRDRIHPRYFPLLLGLARGLLIYYRYAASNCAHYYKISL